MGELLSGFTRNLLIPLLGLVIIVSCWQPAQSAEPLLRGGIGETVLNGIDLDSRVGIRITKAGPQQPFKATVTQVRLGSSAYYGGIALGDHILKASLENSTVALEIERAGHVYQARLPTQVQRTPLLSQLDKNRVSTTEPKLEGLELLAAHDVVIIIDRSGSMRTPDCPGGETRWDWCKDQTVSLMQKAASRIDGITLVTFSENFDVHRDCNIDAVRETFNTYRPNGRTATAAPIEDQLAEYLRKRAENRSARPLLLAIITDGEPNLPGGPEQAKEQVRRAIVDATKEMLRPNELSITFLAVGPTFEGGSFLQELDENLVSEGAKFDVVTTKSFAQLQQTGLMQALIDAVSTVPGS